MTLSTSRYHCNVSVIPIYHCRDLLAADLSVTDFVSLSPTLGFPHLEPSTRVLVRTNGLYYEHLLYREAIRKAPPAIRTYFGRKVA